MGLAEGEYRAEPDDGFSLRGAAIINSVRCLPPQNKPNPDEIATCRAFYNAVLDALPHVRVLVALGAIAHGSAVRIAGGGRRRTNSGIWRSICCRMAAF